MTSSLKSQNGVALYALMAANLVVFCAVLKGRALFAGDWIGAIHNLSQVLPAGVGLILTGILNAQLSPNAKSRIVFMRWRNPLPGCDAFTRYAHIDPRINVAALEKQYGPLPAEPRVQNATWYKLYKTIESEPAVVQAHRSFLFARDYCCIALMVLLVLGSIALVQMASIKIALLYVGCLIFQLLLAGQAARNHGRRFVSTVLAIKSSEH